MMDASFISRIVELADPNLKLVDGLTFCDRKMYRVVDDPRPETLEVHTLTAIADFLENGPDSLIRGELILHVEGPASVAILGPVEGPTKKRTVHLKSSIVGQPFEFGQYIDTEAFIIALQARFAEGGDRAQILSLVGNVRQEKVYNHSDDGISQSVSTRKTVSGALAETSPVPNPVKLRPYRTFRELQQPVGAFVFRMKGGGEGESPKCALIEADGGKWKLDAIEAIKKWLTEFCPEMAVIG